MEVIANRIQGGRLRENRKKPQEFARRAGNWSHQKLDKNVLGISSPDLRVKMKQKNGNTKWGTRKRNVHSDAKGL